MEPNCFNYLQHFWETTGARGASKQTSCPRCRDLDEHAAVEDQLHQIGAILGYDTEELRQSRAELRADPCPQCTLYLLMKAIDTILPVEDIPGWMERPHPALNGKTPLECIQSRRYEEVIDTLFRLEQANVFTG